ncbi:MAG: Gldg family protein, partial [Bacteroidota bacterium]
LENNVPGKPNDVILNESNSLLEYKFSRAIDKLVNVDRPIIAYTTGHGELPPFRVADLLRTLVQGEQYEVGPLFLDSLVAIPQDVKAIIVAKPTKPFTDIEAFKLDQYVMNGGKVLWAVDAIGMSLDSLRGRNEFYPNPYDLGALETLFFRYGFRISEELVLDLNNTRIPITTSFVNGQPQIERFPFPYHVLAVPNGNHPIIKNLDPIDLRFPASVDISVDGGGAIEKTVLLTTSERSRFQRLPSGVDLDVQKFSLETERFNKGKQNLAVLLEGTFSSPFENRIGEEQRSVLRQVGNDYKAESVPTRMIVVSDGDILANSMTPEGEPRPLGFNAFEGYQFDNKTLLVNMLEYLLDDEGVITARGKEVKLRLLNRDAAVAESTKWQVINIALPIVFLLLFGLVYNYVRRAKYAK